MSLFVDFYHWVKGLAHPDTLRVILNVGGPAWVSYAIMAGIIFSETGLLIGFFLPGDSLLFAAGILSSQGVFDVALLASVLSVAAIVGDAVNYYFGLQTGEHVFERGRLRFVRHSHLVAAREFYERHGGKAIVLARFVPLVRTFTPFVAGVARMGYRQFLLFNLVGGIGWIVSMLAAGYWLGQIAIVRDHFELTIIGIVLLSVLPILIKGACSWLATRSTAVPTAPE